MAMESRMEKMPPWKQMVLRIRQVLRFIPEKGVSGSFDEEVCVGSADFGFLGSQLAYPCVASGISYFSFATARLDYLGSVSSTIESITIVL
jgi:hypothetical protein